MNCTYLCLKPILCLCTESDSFSPTLGNLIHQFTIFLTTLAIFSYWRDYSLQDVQCRCYNKAKLLFMQWWCPRASPWQLLRASCVHLFSTLHSVKSATLILYYWNWHNLQIKIVHFFIPHYLHKVSSHFLSTFSSKYIFKKLYIHFLHFFHLNSL